MADGDERYRHRTAGASRSRPGDVIVCSAPRDLRKSKFRVLQVCSSALSGRRLDFGLSTLEN